MVATYIAYTKVYDTTVQVKPETQNARKLITETGATSAVPTVFNSTRVTSGKATSASVTTLNTAALLLAAQDPDPMVSGTITTTNASGAILSAPVVWFDGATGTLTQVADTTRPILINSYVITHVLAGVTKTYTQPTVTRNASGFLTVIPAIVIT